MPAVFHSSLTLSLYEKFTSHNPINSTWTKSSPSFFLIVYSVSEIRHIAEVKLGYECMFYVDFEVKNRKVINIKFCGNIVQSRRFRKV